MRIPLLPVLAFLATVTACSSAAVPTAAPASSNAQRIFVVADGAIVYARTTAYTNGTLDLYITTGTGLNEKTIYRPSLTRLDNSRWAAKNPDNSGSFVFDIGVEYRIQMFDRSRPTLQQNPDYGDEFIINGQRIVKVGTTSSSFQFISSYCRYFTITTAGTIQ